MNTSKTWEINLVFLWHSVNASLGLCFLQHWQAVLKLSAWINIATLSSKSFKLLIHLVKDQKTWPIQGKYFGERWGANIIKSMLVSVVRIKKKCFHFVSLPTIEKYLIACVAQEVLSSCSQCLLSSSLRRILLKAPSLLRDDHRANEIAAWCATTAFSKLCSKGLVPKIFHFGSLQTRRGEEKMFSWHNIDYGDVIFFYLELTISSYHQLNSENISKYGKCECPLRKNKKVAGPSASRSDKSTANLGILRHAIQENFNPIFFPLCCLNYYTVMRSEQSNHYCLQTHCCSFPLGKQAQSVFQDSCSSKISFPRQL